MSLLLAVILTITYVSTFITKIIQGSSRGRDRTVVGFTTTCAINAYHHSSCEFESCSWRGVLYTTLCDKVCQWFSLGTPVSSTNKTDHHNVTETQLKVALNIITLNHYSIFILNLNNSDFHVSSRSEFLVVMSITIST